MNGDDATNRRDGRAEVSDVLEAIVIGAGQAGLATSYCLRQRGIDHLVLERAGIGESWRSKRWESFCLVTPNWSLQLPGAAYDGEDPDGFMPRDDFVRYLEDWARSFASPVVTGIEVTGLRGADEGFALETTKGAYRARNVVVATSNYQNVRIPDSAQRLPERIRQLGADAYWNPEALPGGGVLVVGSGQTGCQIAEELNAAGRPTFLCVGRAGRLPRRYRGRDCIEWQRDMGYLDRTPEMLDDPNDRFRGDPHLSGRGGGHTISLHDFHRDGTVLLGRLLDCDGEAVRLADDLHDQMRFADDFSADIIAKFDAHITRNDIEAPPAMAEDLAGGPGPERTWPPIQRSLNLRDAGIDTVIWATGYRFDFSWVEFPVFDESGYPITRDGATPQPGLYFMGLNWMSKRKSGIVYGVGEDASRVVASIAGRADDVAHGAALRRSGDS